MHILFAVSLLVQLTLAVHAYRHGRISPWVWIILFFPVVGSLLYAVLFIVPEVTRDRGSGRPSPHETRLRRVTPGPFARRGDRPDNAIAVRSVAEIESRVEREDCPECGESLCVDDHRADTIAGRRLRVIVANCKRCGVTPVRYFEISS